MYMLATGSQTIQYFIPTLVEQLGYTGYTKQYMVGSSHSSYNLIRDMMVLTFNVAPTDHPNLRCCPCRNPHILFPLRHSQRASPLHHPDRGHLLCFFHHHRSGKQSEGQVHVSVFCGRWSVCGLSVDFVGTFIIHSFHLICHRTLLNGLS